MTDRMGDRRVLGINASVAWATMIFGAACLDLWSTELAPMIQNMILTVWCFGVHAVALWLYRRDRMDWDKEFKQ